MARGWWNLVGGLVAIALVAGGATPAVAVDDEVEIPDPAFRACLAAKLNGLPLTAENLAAAPGELTCANRTPVITSLSGAEYLTQITRLRLQHNAITDLKPIAQLPSLVTLYLDGNRISDLSQLANPELTNLSFGGNPVASMRPLALLPKLANLRVFDPVAAKLSELADLPGLLTLILGKPVTGDLGFLSELTGLEGLTLSLADSVSSIDWAVLPPKLKSLTVNANGLESLAGVERSTNLVSLVLSRSKVSDLGPLADLTELDSVVLSESKVSNLAPLKRLTGLATLKLPGAQITDVSALAGLTGLTNLALGGNKVDDLTPLSGLTNLENLQLSKVDEVAPLSGLASLKSLSLTGGQISEIEPLAALENLTSLDLSWNAITDLRPLAALRRLNTLRLDTNLISDITALGSLTELTTLDLAHNRITDFSPLAAWKGHLSAQSQSVQLSGARVDTPLPLRLRGADGETLTVTSPAGGTCVYRAGDLICATAGSASLSFRDGPSDQTSQITGTVAIEIPERDFDAVGRPSFQPGIAFVGQPVKIQPGTWVPVPDSITYQWYSDSGRPIPGATSSTFTPLGGEANSVGVWVTAHRRGYKTAMAWSGWKSLAAADLTKTPTPTISYAGRVATDTMLTVNPGIWDDRVTLSYQWLLDGEKIAGATAATHQVKASELGHFVGVQVTGSKPGFVTVVKFSASVVPARAAFAKVRPTMDGTRAVGQTLRVPAVWPIGSILKYQWYRNNRAISGATKSTYLLRAADRSSRFRVKVTASKAGYAGLTMTSETTERIAPGTLVVAPAQISGVPALGKTLTALTGAWGPGSVAHSYRWYRDGEAIRGATGKNYRVKQADRGHVLKVRVSGSKPGYTTTRRTSPAVTVQS